MSDPITRLNAALEGRYYIESELGEGGMATVYLADDLKHERKVALKVLKPELAAVVGAERFLAEIKTTANLQHPHILALFDSGEADKFLFYVMPYIEGETLRDRIDREKQLPVDEALGIATAVANALHTAHEQGVVHRDIKPGNILLSRGEPLVADFGIALAVSAGGGGRLTETGLSLGTPYYMSPEQATGDQAVGPASDTFALACVLYEMLVGEPPYPGNTAQAVLGKIIQGVPVSATAIRKAVPTNVDAAIRKALEKLPADRFTGAQDFTRALADPGFRHGDLVGAGAGVEAGPWKRLTLATTALAGVLALALGWALLRPEPPLAVAQFEDPFREGQEPTSFAIGSFNLSPDGSVLVYRGPGEAGGTQLWARRGDDLDGSPIRGTESGREPAVSPDGQRLAFVRSGEVMILSFEGGPIRPLTTGNWPRWGPDEYVYVLVDNATVRLPATGGPAEPVTQLADEELMSFVSDFLPGGKGALVHVGQPEEGYEIRALNLDTGETTPLIRGFFPRYAASGHLVFISSGTLMAAPFDPKAMEITGSSVSMVEGVVQYALSETGDLVYTTATEAGGIDLELVWVSREGDATPVGWAFASGGNSRTWRLSPDGTQVAYRALTESNPDIWIKTLPDGPQRRLTRDEGNDNTPWWTPDSRTVTYLSGDNVWSTPADGTGEPTLLFDGGRDFRDGLWGPDGEWLVLRTRADVVGAIDQGDRAGIVGFRWGTDSVPIALAATEGFSETGPALSPDGRWLAYASRETGRYEVEVRPFPEVESGKHPVSANGGVQPRWGSSSELFYVTPERNLVAVQIDTGSDFRIVAHDTLFAVPTDIYLAGADARYDVQSGGQQFLMARFYSSGQEGPGQTYRLVQNFFEELKERVPN